LCCFAGKKENDSRKIFTTNEKKRREWGANRGVGVWCEKMRMVREEDKSAIGGKKCAERLGTIG
jgi:hypothetical protein